MWITKTFNGMWCAKARERIFFSYSLDNVIASAVEYMRERSRVLSSV